MSLILLRKDCEPILENAGFDMFHIEVKSKALTIVGQCGQTVVRINSIKFSSDTRFSKEERDYSVELFKRWIQHNVKTLRKYVEAQSAFKALDKPELKGKHVKFIGMGYGMNSSNINSFNDHDGYNYKIVPINLEDVGKEQIIVHTVTTSSDQKARELPIVEVINNKMPLVIAEVIELCKAHREYSEASKEVQEIRNKLNPACDI